MTKYHIYTDGACSGNPGRGGWATIIMNEDETAILDNFYDSEEHTTNNRMELKAMLCALQYASDHPDSHCIIHSDSAYVVNSCNSWMRNWASNGWRNSKKQEVENIDLMKALWGYLSRDFFNADIKKCSGHAGDTGNELADALATRNIARYKDIINHYDILEPFDQPEEIRLFEFKQDLKLGDNWFPND